MINVKGFAVMTDGSMKRVAVTFDQVDENGKVVKANVRVNRIVTQGLVSDALKVVEEFAQEVAEEA